MADAEFPGAPATFVPRWLGEPARRVYEAELARRNRRFDRRIGVRRLDRPVVSVGNLSVGGTGKTPMVAHILALLRGRGHEPCVAMRGYRPSSAGSDEACLYRAAFADLPIVAQADRLAGLEALLATPTPPPSTVGDRRGRPIDVVVLDDGFQHRRIARDLDLVLIDATCDPFSDACLPAGRLREPIASLGRADAVIVTHAEAVDAEQLGCLCRRLEGIDRPPLAITRHDWSGLLVVENGVKRDEPVRWLSDRAVVAACAIGNPGAFINRVGRSAGRLIATMVLPDHDPFRPRTISRLLRQSDGAGAIVLTAKDWVKLSQRRVQWSCPVVIPRLVMRFDQGQEALESAVLRAIGSGERSAAPAAR